MSDNVANTRQPVAGLMLANLGVAIAGLISTSMTAWIFGVGREAAVFFSAWSITSVLERLFQAGQIAELTIPAYQKDIVSHGSDEADRRFSVVINTAMAFVALATGLFSFFAFEICRVLLPGLSADDRLLAAEMSFWLLLLIPFVVLNGLLQSLGNARGMFGKFELWLVAGSLAGSAATLLLHRPLGGWALVLSAWAVQLTANAGRIIQLSKSGYRHHWIFSTPGFSQWVVFRELSYTSVYAAVTQVYLMGFNAALTFLPSAAYAAFRYGDQLFVRTSSLFLRPVSTVFYTRFSRLLANKSAEAGESIRSALAHFSDIWAVYTTILVATAYALMASVWGGKNFGPEAIAVAMWVFLAQVVAVAFRATGTIFRKHNLAHGAVKAQYLGNIVAQLFSAAVAPFLVRTWGLWGGVAMLVINMLLVALADGIVASRLGANPLHFIPWRRYFAWAALIVVALAAGFWASPLRLPDDLSLADKLDLMLQSVGRVAVALGLLALGAVWIGYGNILYLLGIKERSIAKLP
jgi:peptidoglycan biosynthesis protein MviN/MurJ (putative lipid II flippase)